MTFLEFQDLLLLLWRIITNEYLGINKKETIIKKYASFYRLLETHLSFENHLFLNLNYKLIFCYLKNVFNSTKMKHLQLNLG